MNPNSNYNKYIVLSKSFEYYRTYLYRVDNFEFFTADYLKLVYVIKGNITLEFEDSTFDFSKGDLFFIGNNMSYKIKQNRNINTLIIVDIKEDYLNKHYNNYFRRHIAINISKNKYSIINNMSSLYDFMIKDESYSNEALNVLNSLIKTLTTLPITNNTVKNNASVRSTIYRISNYIRVNLESICNDNILLSDIAYEFNINYHYLSRRFTEIIGLNYSEFLLYLKLNKSVDLLVNSDLKITDIIVKSHFKDANSFNIHFKNTFNLTPTEFRKIYYDFNETIKYDFIHLEDSTKTFFSQTKLSKNLLHDNNNTLNYNIDIRNTKNKIFNLSDNIFDLNNIIDINHGYNIIEDVFDSHFVKNIIIHLMLIDENIYILDKNDNKIDISMHELRHLLNILNKNNCRLYFIFNYYLNEDSISICYTNILNILSFISSVLGFNHIDSNLFGLRFINLSYYISLNNFKVINSNINTFISTLNKIYNNYNYSWMLFIEDIQSESDLNKIENLKNNLSIFPDKYLVGFNYSNFSVEYPLAINFFISLANNINKILNKNNNREIIIGFNHNITDLFENDDYAIRFATLFCLTLYINFILEGYRIGFINYEFMENNRLIKHNKFTHNALGIITSNYLITYVLKSMENRLVYTSNGMLSTCNNDSLTIVLYDDFENFYKDIKDNHIINPDKTIDYCINIFGLKGNYKVIEYTFDLSDDLVMINHKNLVNISDRDKYLLSISNNSKIDIKFIEIFDSYLYFSKRKNLEFKYLHFQKIY